MLCVQAFGVHLHIAKVAAGQEIELHVPHLNPSDAHVLAHEEDEHTSEVDIDIVQLLSRFADAKLFKAGFVPLVSVAGQASDFVALYATRSLLERRTLAAHPQPSWRPPLRAPPLFA